MIVKQLQKELGEPKYVINLNKEILFCICEV